MRTFVWGLVIGAAALVRLRLRWRNKRSSSGPWSSERCPSCRAASCIGPRASAVPAFRPVPVPESMADGGVVRPRNGSHFCVGLVHASTAPPGRVPYRDIRLQRRPGEFCANREPSLGQDAGLAAGRRRCTHRSFAWRPAASPSLGLASRTGTPTGPFVSSRLTREVAPTRRAAQNSMALSHRNHRLRSIAGLTPPNVVGAGADRCRNRHCRNRRFARFALGLRQ